ncbi:hypothetical protein M0805_003371 [Coniferiporia weirii]|nr:hypothetical protein M0805_003371 [Coniferiporia weirii]
MPSRPSRKPNFAEPQHFSPLQADSSRWYCNLCSSPALAEHSSMSTQLALRHEKSGPHKQKVNERESWNPQPGVDAWLHDNFFESKVSERMLHVDQLKDIIPFWQQQIEAAERGETLRYEEFLDTLAQKNDDNEEPVWNVPMPDWALEPVDGEDRSSETGHVRHSEELDGSDEEVPPQGSLEHDSFMFVEKVANMSHVDAERKKRLHKFYKVPTTEKLERIQELIDVLRTA